VRRPQVLGDFLSKTWEREGLTFAPQKEKQKIKGKDTRGEKEGKAGNLRSGRSPDRKGGKIKKKLRYIGVTLKRGLLQTGDGCIQA